MKLKCINKPTKFKNLSLNNEYEGIIDGDNYVVTNDSGLRAKYASKYFNVVPTEVPLLSAVSSLSFDLDGEDLQIFCNDEDQTITLSQASNSCGIYDVDGLGGIISLVEDIHTNLSPNVVGTRLDLFRHIITSLVAYIKTQRNLAFITFSDNLNNAEEMPYKDVMNEMAVTFAEGVNRNSSNTIRLWIFN